MVDHVEKVEGHLFLYVVYECKDDDNDDDGTCGLRQKQKKRGFCHLPLV